MRPSEARSLCAQADTESTLEELRRRGIDAMALGKLLRCRDATRWSAWSGSVELSDEHGRRTEAAVHVPAHDPGRQLGALIVLHGAGGSGEQVLAHFSRLGDRLSMAVVCPTAQMPPQRSSNLDLAGIFGKRFDMPRWDLAGRDFPLAALRWARTGLDVDPDRCAVAGVSMGGLATWNLGMRFWHSFSAAVPINGALSVWESFGTDRRTNALLPNTLPLAMFVIHGGRDAKIPPRFDRDSVASLRALGHRDLDYVEIPDGEHRLETLGLEEGRPLFRRLEHWLDRRRRVGQPAEVHHRATEDRHGRARWVRIGGIDPHDAAEVHARRITSSRIDVEVTGARHVTLYLSGAWHAPGDVVAISVNRAVTAVRFDPSLATIVESFRDTADPELVAEQIVHLDVPQPAASRSSDTHARRNHADSI